VVQSPADTAEAKSNRDMANNGCLKFPFIARYRLAADISTVYRSDDPIIAGFLEANRALWRSPSALSSRSGRGLVVLVDVIHDHPAVLQGNLLIAKYLAILTRADLVGVISDWRENRWPDRRVRNGPYRRQHLPLTLPAGPARRWRHCLSSRRS